MNGPILYADAYGKFSYSNNHRRWSCFGLGGYNLRLVSWRDAAHDETNDRHAAVCSSSYRVGFCSNRLHYCVYRQSDAIRAIKLRPKHGKLPVIVVITWFLPQFTQVWLKKRRQQLTSLHKIRIKPVKRGRYFKQEHVKRWRTQLKLNKLKVTAYINA